MTATITKRAGFAVVYDGPALREGLIEVRELAPALLSLGQLVDRVNEIENHGKAKASLQIEAGFEKGSFAVVLALDVSLLQEVAGLLFENLKDASTLAKILFGTGSLAGLWKLLRRKADKVEKRPDGTLNVTINNVTINVNEQTYQLSLDPAARKAAAGTLEPLRASGVDEFKIIEREGRDEGETLSLISKEEAAEIIDAVREDPGEIPAKEILDNTATVALRLVKPSFRDSLKWSFSWSGGNLNAAMRDNEFLNSVHRRERSFTDGDSLVVQLRTISRQDDEGRLRYDHEIVKVLEHASAGKKLDQMRIEGHKAKEGQ